LVISLVHRLLLIRKLVSSDFQSNPNPKISPSIFVVVALANDLPARYHSAYIAMLVGYTVKLAMVVVLYIYMWSVNKSRDKAQAERGALSEEEEREAVERGMLDVTEIDNKGFRYIL
jgi:hypothetical protein